MNKITSKGVGIIGHRQGGDPKNEHKHFYVCTICKQVVDKRDLGEVLYHEIKNHEPVRLDT